VIGPKCCECQQRMGLSSCGDVWVCVNIRCRAHRQIGRAVEQGDRGFIDEIRRRADQHWDPTIPAFRYTVTMPETTFVLPVISSKDGKIVIRSESPSE
jgi:hypothetical protein